MASKTFVEGVAYDVTGGRCMVDGTVYDIRRGCTLVDGTEYNIPFAPNTIIVCVTGEGGNRCSVKINGTTYTKSVMTEVNAGDTITFSIGADDDTETGTVKIDGVTFLSRSGGGVQKGWTVPNCRFIHIELENVEYEDEDDGSTNVYGRTNVTTHNVLPVFVTVTGTGSSNYCYATVDGTKYSTATNDIPVWPGDTITFGVYGYSSTYYGELVINGDVVLTVTDKKTTTYSWTVPDGIAEVKIDFVYTSTSTRRNGRITVTMI